MARTALRATLDLLPRLIDARTHAGLFEIARGSYVIPGESAWGSPLVFAKGPPRGLLQLKFLMTRVRGQQPDAESHPSGNLGGEGFRRPP